MQLCLVDCSHEKGGASKLQTRILVGNNLHDSAAFEHSLSYEEFR